MYNTIHSSRRGSALIVGLIIVVLLTIMTTSFLEKVLNLGKISGGINNSAVAYALATGLIEEQLMSPGMTKAAPWGISNAIEGSTSGTGRKLEAQTGGTIIPISGKGNSSFDADWNIIGIGEPVQIVIPAGITSWNSVEFRFRVPSIPGQTSTGSSSAASGVILWTFGYSGASLYASGETNIFKGSDIDGGVRHIDSLNAGNTEGQTNTGGSMLFSAFYSAYESSCGLFQCTLKLSMIRPFVTMGGQTYPFLEYQIDFGSVNVPSQYMVIDSSAYVNGYLRSRQIRIPQVTTNTATDFAVLQ